METLKKWGLYIAIAVAFILGFIAQIIGANRKLEDDVRDLKFEGKDKDLKNEQDKIDRGANDAVAEFQRLRSELRASVISSRDGDS